jgi:glycosyltransferase involved in cell wall biosynthesis
MIVDASFISVIIPVYNGARTIQQTIASVLAQTFSQFELIVIDDGSQDETVELITQIKDPRIQLFSYANAGYAVSRNRGFARSVGAYLSFIDADDLWLPDKLERQYQILQDNPQAAVVYSWTNCIDEQGNFLRKCSYVHWSGNVLPQLLLDDFIGSGSNVMIRREAFQSVGGFDASLKRAHDTDLWLRLAAKYEFAVVPAVQILYRISPSSASSNVVQMEEANLQVIERSFREAPPSLQYLKPYAIANLYKYLCYRSLEVSPGNQKFLVIIRFLWMAVKTDPTLLHKPVCFKAFLKLSVMTLFPVRLAERLLTQFPKLANTSTFLGYEKVNLS